MSWFLSSSLLVFEQVYHVLCVGVGSFVSFVHVNFFSFMSCSCCLDFFCYAHLCLCLLVDLFFFVRLYFFGCGSHVYLSFALRVLITYMVV